MKIRFLLYFICFAVSIPFFFSCSATKEYYSFRPATGKYHGVKAEKIAVSTAEVKPVTAEAKAKQGLYVTPAEMPLTASSGTAPELEANTLASRIQAANADAEAHKATATRQAQKESKPNLVERLALKKMQKVLKRAGENQVKSGTSEKPGLLNKLMLDQNLKLGLVFLLAAIIAGIFSNLLAAILVIVAVVFLILWVMSL